MGYPVYSERFTYLLATQSTKEYLIPDEMRAVVTLLTIVKDAGPTGWVLLRTHGIDTYYAVLPASAVNTHVAMRVVVYQGETIQLNSSAGGVVCSLHGYVFDDRTGRDGPPLAAASKPVPDPPPARPTPHGGG